MRCFRAHFLAWSTFLTAAIIIGCGDGDEPIGNIYTGSVNKVSLNPRTKIVPFDGSAVVSGIGDRGIEVRGANLGNVEPGDFLVVISPIEDDARAAVNHQGGFLTLATGWHLIPRAQLPSRYQTPGNAPYSHFVVHFGRAGERLVETGPLAVSGSRSFARPGNTKRHFIRSIARSLSSAARSVGSAATSAATSVSSAVTSAATAAASSVSAEASRAESAVKSAAASLGPIDSVISTIETVGVHFSEIVEAMELEVQQVVTDPRAAFEEIKELAELVLTGDASFRIGDDGSYQVGFNNLTVSKALSERGSASITLDGSFSFRYSEGASINIKDYKPVSIGYNSSISTQSSLTVSNLSGTANFPLKKIRRTPLVLDAGIPILIVPEVELGVEISGGGGGGITVSGGVTSEAKSSAGFSGVSGSGSLSFSGNVAPQGAPLNANVNLRVSPIMKLYDVAGPQIDFNVLRTTLSGTPGSNQLTVSLSGDIDVQVDLTEIGYKGFTPSVTLFQQSYKTFDIGL